MLLSNVERGGPDTRLARYDHVIVHCTATPEAFYADAEWVDELHRKKGWSGCGYHAVITRAGVWQDHDDGHPTRPFGQSGAHVGGCGRGWNGRSLGISLAGGVTNDGHTPENNFTERQLETLALGLRLVMQLHPSQDLTLLGHRDLIAYTGSEKLKACPCFDVRDWARTVGLRGPIYS